MRLPLYLIIAALVLLVVSSCNPGEKNLKIISLLLYSVRTQIQGSIFLLPQPREENSRKKGGEKGKKKIEEREEKLKTKLRNI